MRLSFLGLACAVAALACHGEAPDRALRTADGPETATPPPTERGPDASAEGGRRREREAWLEERHLAPPDVDWRAIERANGEAQIAKRNRLASLPETYVRWVERGSDNQAGRMHVAAVSTDGQALYAGSSLGGLWKGNLDGTGWTPLGDNLYGGVHWLVALPGTGAGAPDRLLAASDGGLIHLSRDEGQTWVVPAGLPTNTNNVRRLVKTSEGTNTVFLIASTNSRYKLYRSTDFGESFVELVDALTARGDVWVPRNGGSSVFYVKGNELWRSFDLGDTWATVSGIPSGSNNVELVGSEAGGPRLWILTKLLNGTLYRSDDAGATWNFVDSNIDVWFGGSLNASITDADLFAYGGLEVHRTFDGGATFSIVNPWGAYYGDPLNKLHADIPGIDVAAIGPQGETWYISTDGGLYHSQDGLQSVQNLSLEGLRVSQYYGTHTSAADPLHVAAGAQDQGYQWTDQPPVNGTRLDFRQPTSGDYGHLTSGDGTQAYLFMTYPGFILIDRGENNPLLSTASFPAGENNAWLPPVVADPLDIEDFFFCATRIHRYEKNGTANSWSASVWSTEDFSAGASAYCTALVFSPLDPARAYAATNAGALYYSDDHGVTWTMSVSTGPGSHWFYGTALLASATDVNTVYVGGSGYGGPAIKRSTDGGATWEVWDQGLPDTLVYCLGEQPDGSGTIYAGTETSAYRRAIDDVAWEDITGADAPVTIYWSVEALPHETTMRFGTYGRGIWDYRLEPDAQWNLFGCGGNPAGSLAVLGGDPIPGTTMVLGLDNPLATMNPGALSFAFFSLDPDPNYPCGTMVPGFGMAGGSAAGELLIGVAAPDPVATVTGLPWGGTGNPAWVMVPIPDDSDLLGLRVYGQGLLLDPSTPSNRFGLTEGIEMVIGR